MPDKVIDIPGYGQVAFPDSMSEADINAAAGKLYKEKNPDHPPPDPKHSWIDTAVDWLPAAGGAAGGIIGGIGGTVAGMGVGGVPGAIGGAALGGGAGEAAKQLINRARGAGGPSTPAQAATSIGGQALLQGGSEAVGAGLGAVAKPIAVDLMQSALKPTIKLTQKAIARGEVPPVVQTMLKEGITVSPRGLEKLNTLIGATNDEIAGAIKSVSADVQPLKVASKLNETARTFANQVNPASDLEAVSRVGQEFLDAHPNLTVQQAQALKQGTYKQLAGKYGELKGAEIEGQKALARGLKDEIASEVAKAGGPDLGALNAREGAMMTARDATARRVAMSSNRDPMGLASLAVTHPMTFLTVLADRSPAVKSLLARGAWGAAGSVAKVSPQLIRMAVQAVASSEDDQ
jgi:hypothetical protein